MEFCQILGFLTESQLSEKKCSLEDIKRLSPKLTDDDYMLYLIYLQVRPDLPDDERIYYMDLARSLKEREDMNMKQISQQLSNPTVKDG